MSTQKEIGDQIINLSSNVGKDGASRKTLVYKGKKLSQLKDLWKKYEVFDNEVKINSANDADYEKYYEKIQKVYLELSKNLNAIVGPSTQDEEVTIEREMKRQQFRYKSLLKIIDEIEQRLWNQEELSMAFCRLKLTKINELWERIVKTHEEMTIDEELIPDSYFKRYMEVENLVENNQLRLQETLESLNVTKSYGTHPESVKLQRVTIPKYYGDYHKWVTFKDLFIGMVKDNKAYTDAVKLQILKTSLGGEAEGLINDLTISDANFEDAWARLLERYDDNKTMVYRSINKLMSQPAVKGDSKSLKKLLDTTHQTLLMLKNMGRPSDAWDDWIIVVVTQKLDDEIRKDWGKKTGQSKELPTWNQLREFLEEEFKMLEELENSPKRGQNGGQKNNVKSYQVSVGNNECPACKKDHTIWNCSEFKKMSVKKRWEMVMKRRLCFKCLSNEHGKHQCDREKPCKKCERDHNTWLHEDRTKGKKAQANCATTSERCSEKSTDIGVNFGAINKAESTMVVAHSSTKNNEVLLATAVISTFDQFGRQIMLRALIDSGSQGSMLTEEAASLLQLKPITLNTKINPLGGGPAMVARSLTITIQPHFDKNYELLVECYILRKLTSTMPDHELNTAKWNHIKGLQWADPRFYKVGKIDLLLGAEVESEIMRAGLVRGQVGQPIAQHTALGWIISRKVNTSYRNKLNCLVSTIMETDTSLERFWELEELHPERMLTKDELRCENLYDQTFSRDKTGQFTVRIPFKDDTFVPSQLGQSKAQAIARFNQLEKKLIKNNELRTEYVKVIKEYITLGHMIEVTDRPESEKLYYIPHHAVIKPDSLTTKTRVVFDASAKTSTGISLNDCMLTGAKQQDDLFEVLVRWKKHKIVFKSDVEKMYRQILLHPEDQKYHTILWRDNPGDKLREFQMTRVTFGTAAAPFLATKTLKQTAINEMMKHPYDSNIVKEDFYVDDLISGTNDLQTAIEVKEQIIDVLKTGCFQLRKWTSNSSEFLKTLPVEATEKALQLFSEDEASKALGLQWNPNKDTFGFQVSWARNEGKITKRFLLSEASKIFDPLGWLAPVVITAKLMMQEVWLSKTDWDNEISQDIQRQWINFRDELPRLSEITIQRWMNWEEGDKITLHGFGDASEKAYSATVYARIEKPNEVTTQIIAAKTRVASKATKITLPRLELCGSLLVANLLNKVEKALKIGDLDKFGWSDSMITLGWLDGDPGRWKTFVANRVAEAQNLNIKEWNHVRSEENPADCASRGIMPTELKKHALWWTGPSWLKDDHQTWKKVQIQEPDLEKRTPKSVMVNMATIEEKYIGRFSSWQRLIRSISYCKRWKNKKKGPLSMEEIDETTRQIILECQAESFRKELKRLKKKEPIKRTSNLLKLNPFFDEYGIMRVGGRLKNANLPEETKHPIILPSKHHVTKLLIRAGHQDTSHGGPQLMTTMLRKQFWIIQCKRMANNEYKNCVICKRQAGKVAAQIMGDLPAGRVKLDRAFLHTGVDYTGPVQIRSSRLRSARIEKRYISLFICFATRAVHLELVSDQSAEAFLAAFQRFVARRGLVSDMYSDNGGNFVGTSNELDRQLIAVNNAAVAEQLAVKGIKWHFIPPDAPTFGGLWEKNIKSMKSHLKAVLGNTRLTFEEYNTVLCQTEACLNSRPLCPLTDHPENLNVLTPGHFLTGDALLAIPQKSLLDNNSNRTNRWKFLQLLHQHFWKRWSSEYLSQLQQRYKDKEAESNINVGDLVLIKDDDLPPRKWAMARVTELHPGTDGRVRVASLKTENGQTKRGLKKICPLLESEKVDASEPQPPVQKDSSGDKTRK